MTQEVLQVSQVNEYIRRSMDTDPLLCNIAVRGEISNYKCYPSGHHYFTLKDADGALKCVMFKGNAFRLRFQPENGMKVIAAGHISVYPRDGAYQLYCDAMFCDGIGDLHVAFEQLKVKLAALGLFDPENKKPIPKYPVTVGVITSEAGAAVHDILRILRKRYPLANVRLFPVRVQGEEAPAEISAAIAFANRHQLADVLIVGRGGGSIEDLWAFNTEQVAYAVYESKIPVISAVGHEPDVTICDYVADLRAATPSNGAELAVPDQSALEQQLDKYTASMQSVFVKQVKGSAEKLRLLKSSAALRDPGGYLTMRAKHLELLQSRLLSAQNRMLDGNQKRFVRSAAALDALSPLKVLSRGYTMTMDEDRAILRSVKDVSLGQRIQVQFHDGEICADVVAKKEKMV